MRKLLKFDGVAAGRVGVAACSCGAAGEGGGGEVKGDGRDAGAGDSAAFVLGGVRGT